MDRLKAMEIFVRVVDAGGLAKAAQTLSIPRSSVTMTLQQLERYLGVRLVQRSTRQISLTADGTTYYRRCLNILAEVADTEASLRQELDNPRGRVRVDLPGAIATSMLLPDIGKFRERYPNIDLAIGLNDRRVDLIQEGVDLAIRIGVLGDSSFIAKRIGSFNWVTCAAPSYLGVRGRPESPENLVGHDVVGYFSAGGTPNEQWTFGRGDKTTDVTVTSSIAVNETSAYLTLGLQGHGLIRLANYIVDPYLQSGALVEVLPEFRPKSVPVSVIYPTSRHLSPAVRVFVDWVSSLFMDVS